MNNRYIFFVCIMMFMVGLLLVQVPVMTGCKTVYTTIYNTTSTSTSTSTSISQTSTSTSTSTSIQPYVMDDFEDGDLVNDLGGEFVAGYNSGGYSEVRWTSDDNHTSPGGAVPGCMLVYLNRTTGSVYPNCRWSSSESTTEYTTTNGWIRTKEGTIWAVLYAKSSSWIQWDRTLALIDTNWQLQTSEVGTSGAENLYGIYLECMAGEEASVYVDDITVE